MVMAYRGVDVAPEAMAQLAFDETHDIYGNWPRNIQAAYSKGVPGYLTRFTRWSDVASVLRQGTPIIASIKVRPAELPGAPYTSTAGHLIVIRGIDADGMILVNDPAAWSADRGVTRYRPESLERVWFGRGKGTAYVLGALPPS